MNKPTRESETKSDDIEAILLCNRWLNEYAKAFDTLEGFAEWYDGETNHEH